MSGKAVEFKQERELAVGAVGGFRHGLMVTLCACVVCNRPLCQAQRREPRKWDFCFPFLFCVAEDKQWVLDSRVFLCLHVVP